MYPFDVFKSNILSDQENGRELEEKGCGLYEGSNYEYNDGCETRHVPFKSKECYCKSSLCNGAEMMPVGSLIRLIIPTIILSITINFIQNSLQIVN